MIKNRLARWVLVLIVLFALGLAACQSEAPDENPDLKIDPVALTAPEKDALLGYARMKLAGKNAPAPDKKAAPQLHAKKRSALFVSLTWPKKTAQLAFGQGQTVLDALDQALTKIPAAVSAADRAAARVRVDLVTKTFKPVKIESGEKPSFHPSIHGLYLRTNPPLALHPLEIVSRGMVRLKGTSKKRVWQYKQKSLKAIAKMRGFSDSDIPNLKRINGLAARPFWVDGFIEDEQGKALDLYRWAPRHIDVTPERIRQRCVLAGQYLKSIIDDEGRFDYRYYPEADESSKSYNMLRHCGTTYSMVQLYELTRDPELLEKIKLAINFVADDHVSDPRKKDAEHTWKCVRGEGFSTKKREYCKLGGAGLFLVVLSTYTRATGDTAYLPLMKDMAKFIQFMQKSDGQMESKYYFNDRPHKPFTSLFYPGEASYGLGLLYQHDPNAAWIETGHKAINWLHQQRKGTAPWRLPVDHWLVIAMNELYKADKNDSNKQHAFDICKGMIQTQRVDPPQLRFPDIYGGWGSKPQTSANATRVEGLVAAYHMAEQAGDDPEPFFACAWNAANVLLRLQLTDVGVSYFPRPDRALGGYLAQIDAPEIQIDNVQHATSALLGIFHIYNQRQGRLPDLTRYKKWRAEKK